jgi:predicted RNA-binding protein
VVSGGDLVTEDAVVFEMKNDSTEKPILSE